MIDGGGGGSWEVSGVSFQTLVFWVVIPRTPVDVSEQPAASKRFSGREETKGRRRFRFRRGGVSSLSANSAVWLRWQSLGCDIVQRKSLPQSQALRGVLFYPEGGGSTLFRNVCKLFP